MKRSNRQHGAKEKPHQGCCGLSRLIRRWEGALIGLSGALRNLVLAAIAYEADAGEAQDHHRPG